MTGRFVPWCIRLGARVLVLLLLFPAAGEAHDRAPNDELLDEIWDAARARLYPSELRQRFDAAQRDRIASAVTEGSTLADVLNPFLLSLGVSHTYFHTPADHGFYLLRSLFASRELDQPALDLLGLQLADEGRIQAVLEGFAADYAGVTAGDRILAVNGRSFSSVLDWQGLAEVVLTINTGQGVRDVGLMPVRMGYHRALLEATRNSARRFNCEGRTISYLHLWSGTDDAFHAVLAAAAEKARAERHAGFILDLRDGFGGAWWSYLDPFYPNRASYFIATRFDPDGQVQLVAPAQENSTYYAGPMVVLINAGTRSGKESLAFNFKKTGRAQLFGSTTAGAFTAGAGVFADRPEADYLLYLSVAELRLDEQIIEGVGVVPDRQIRRQSGSDAPMSAALESLGCLDGSAS